MGKRSATSEREFVTQPTGGTAGVYWLSPIRDTGGETFSPETISGRVGGYSLNTPIIGDWQYASILPLADMSTTTLPENPLIHAIHQELYELEDNAEALEAVLRLIGSIRKGTLDPEISGWLAVAESSMDFWDNDEDAIFDDL